MDYVEMMNHPEFEDAKQEAELLYIKKGLSLSASLKTIWINRTVHFILRNSDRKNSNIIPLSTVADQKGCKYIDFDSYCFQINESDIEDKLTYNMIMETLPNDEKELLEMYIVGYDYDEISEILNITNTTARQRIFKIKRKHKTIFTTHEISH